MSFLSFFNRTRNYRSAKNQIEIDQIEKDTYKSCEFIRELKLLYNSIYCQCAYPRFRQIVSLDCTKSSGAYYISETENFLHAFRDEFIRKDIKTDVNILVHEQWECKKCSSLYEYELDEFSISVKRAVLNLKELKIKNIGADELFPAPLFIGSFGQSKPDRNYIQLVDLPSFKKYMIEESTL